MEKRLFPVLAGLLILLIGPGASRAQNVEDKIDEYVRKISEGRYTDARKAVADTTTGLRPGDPGVIYLEGLIAPDGTTAIRMFRTVADSLGSNPWRDDALARMFEIYSRINDRTDASGVLRTLRADHPSTPYITTGYLEKVAAEQDTLLRSDSTGRIVAIYAIQVGAFSVFENAEKLVALLKSKGLSAIIYDNLLDGKHLLHLVWVGRFDTPEDAAPELKRIEELTGIRGVLREQQVWRRW
jgi:hypothetical protein